jgi:hypothetical protein
LQSSRILLAGTPQLFSLLAACHAGVACTLYQKMYCTVGIRTLQMSIACTQNTD